MDIRKLDFEFDLNGFCIIRDAISLSKIKKMNEIIDTSKNVKTIHKFQFLELDKIFFDLIFENEVLEICDRWIGPNFRFDHAWGVQFPPNYAGGGENLHAGPYQNQGFFQYNWRHDRPSNSCLLFSYALLDQSSLEGGLVIIPGSHKSNFRLSHANKSIFDQLYDGDFKKIPTLYRPDLKAGDLLIMSEATIHGTDSWRSEFEWRRTLYYKYCYGFMGWIPHDNSQIINLRKLATSDLQRRVLEAPYVSKVSGNNQEWRESTIKGFKDHLIEFIKKIK